MGTDDGELTIDEGAATPVWLATLSEGGGIQNSRAITTTLHTITAELV